LNGNSQQVLALFGDQAWANAGGSVISSSGTGHLLINQDNSARNWAGTVSGDVKVTKQGQQTLNLYSASSFTNSLMVNGGNVLLTAEGAMPSVSAVTVQYGGLYFDNNPSSDNLADRLNDSAAIAMRGGILELRGRQQTASSEDVGAVSLLDGNSLINAVNGAAGVGLASVQLNLASLSRTTGQGTVVFRADNGGQAGSFPRITVGSINGADTSVVGGGLINGIIGGWAIFSHTANPEHFATYIPGLGLGYLGQAGFPNYAPATVISNSTLATDNIRLAANSVSTITDDVTVNSINTQIGTINVNIAAAKTLTVNSGGILSFNNNAWFIGQNVNQGFLTSGQPELFFYTQGNVGPTVNAVISGAIGLVKSGAGNMTLAGLNTYTGGTTVNQGTLNVNAGSRIPLATDPAKGLILNNVTFTQSFAGVVDPGNIVTLNAGSALNYFDHNTQAGLVFNNLGGTGTPIVRTFNNASPANGAGTNGVLTIGAAGIVATSANVGTTAVIEGRVDFGTTAKTINIASIDVNGVSDVAPLQPSLILQGIVGTSGGINKEGAGVLQLNAQAGFAGAFNVNAGGVRNGVTNAGSRFSRLTLAAGTRYDLNNASTAWGSLAGSGDVFTGAAGTPTLTVGFDNTSSSFTGRLVAFNDAAYPLLTKVGSGVLTLSSAQDSSGSWGAITVNGGSVFYTGAGAAFQSTSAAAAGTFNVNVNGVLQLDNLTSALNNRLGLSQFGTVQMQGGRFLVSGNASTAVTERVTTLNMTNGGGRVELSSPGAGLRLSVGTLSGGNNTGSMVLAGITGNATGSGVVNLSIDTPNYVALNQQGGDIGGVYGVFTGNGSTNMIVRGDILADAAALGQGTGFLVRDTVTLTGAVTTNNSATIAVPSTAGILVGSTVTSLDAGMPAGALTVTAVDSVANTVTISNGLGMAPSADRQLTFGNFFRALADNELNYASGGLTGWRQAQNGGVFASQTAAQTVGVDTVLNTLTFSGAATSLGSSLGSAFGRFGQGGRLLTQEFRGATAFLVRDGTATLDVGSFTSNTGVTLFGHVLTGATANVNSSFGLNQTSGFVKTGGGVINFNRPTYFTGGTFTVNGGTVNLN
ncbi:MAG: beta strand repeat-containing protein, partial [Opitutia bacterium]